MAKPDLFKVVASVVETRNTIPALSCVYNDGERIHATDLDVYVSAPTPEGREPGALDTKGFMVAPADWQGDLRAVVQNMNKLADVSELESETFVFEDLHATLSRVAHCISTEETRYYLVGVFFNTEYGTLELAASDGYRLARLKTNIPCTKRVGVIVPRKTILTVMKLKGGKWSATWNETHIILREAESGVRILSKLVDGAFPDYPRVIPRIAATDSVFTGDATACRKALLPFSKYGNERSKCVAVTGDTLRAQAANMAPLEALWPITAEWRGAVDPFEIGVNSKSLCEALDAFDKAAKFRMFLSGPANPVRIEEVDNPDFVQVVMPLRV